jgi:hypothetical protein
MRNRHVVPALLAALAGVCGLLAAPSLAAAEPEPFGHACKAENGDDWWGHPGPPESGQLATSGTGSIATDGGLASEPQCGTQ